MSHHDGHGDAETKAVEPFYEQSWFNGSLFIFTGFVVAALVGMFVVIALSSNHLHSQCGSQFSILPITLFVISLVALILLMVYLGSKSIFRSAELEKMESSMRFLQHKKPERVDTQMLKDFFKTGCLATAAILSILAFAAFTAYFFAWVNLFYGSTSLKNGILNLKGLKKDVYVKRDKFGVPHLESSFESDMWFAQGVVHAQERFWQMEVHRKVAQGRLSELMGSETIEIDKTSRTLGFYILAQRSWNLMSNSTKSVINSYVAGINEYLSSSETSVPLEYMLFYAKPELFTALDVVAFSKLFQWQMMENHRDEVDRFQMLQKGLSIAKVASFYPEATFGPTILSTAEANITDSTATINNREASWKQTNGTFVPSKLPADSASPKNDIFSEYLKFGPKASNSWVIDGRFTDSGEAYLANDPHLGFSAPGPMLMMHLNWNKQEIIGATLPGLPGVIIGRTENMTWGLTSNQGDQSDYFALSSIDKTRYTYKNVATNFVFRKETIKVRRATDVIIDIKESVYGPVMNDALKLDAKTGTDLAISWMGQEANDGTLDAFLNCWKAKDYFEFRNSFNNYVAPIQNVVYADTDGNIAYFVAGRVPTRRPGHTGMFPVRGDGSFDYLGRASLVQFPTILNPDRGFIVTANNRVTPAGWPVMLTQTFPGAYRAKRITDMIQAMIAAKKKITKNDIINMQYDVTSEPFFRLKFIFDRMAGLTGRYETHRQDLLKWNGNMNNNVSNIAATIFESWLMDMGKIVGPIARYRRDPEYIFTVVNGSPLEDCTKLDVVGAVNCQDYATKKFRATIDTLYRRFGAVPKWGQDVHKSAFNNLILGNSPVGCLVNAEIFTPGGTDTVYENVPFGNDTATTTYTCYMGPVYRQIVDLNNTESSLFMVAPGQSGNIIGLNYKDLVENWATKKYIRMETQNYNLVLPDQPKTIKQYVKLRPED